MQAESLTVGDDGAARLRAELQLALSRAESWEYDLPSTTALGRADGLIGALAAGGAELDSVDVAIGIDGSIDFTVGASQGYATIEVSPSGNRIQMLVRSIASGELVTHLTDATEAEVVRQLERAA